MTTTEADTRENGQVYEDHALELTRYATVLVGPDDAPDIVTDAVLNAFASPNWRRVENRRAYLFRSVLNHANSFHRSGSRRRRREALSIVRDQPLRSRPDGGSHSINLATGVATRLTGAISGTL